jgi:N-acetylmuramoyl-L-alanine amidase
MVPDEIIIHHSAADDFPDLQWPGIRTYHMTPQNQGGPVGGPWLDIGYHAGVEAYGSGFEMLIGRPWDFTGAHCKGHNTHALGLCFVGNTAEDELPQAQLVAGVKVIRMWMRLFRVPPDRIFRHSDFENTECPGGKFPWAKMMSMLV